MRALLLAFQISLIICFTYCAVLVLGKRKKKSNSAIIFVRRYRPERFRISETTYMYNTTSCAHSPSRYAAITNSKLPDTKKLNALFKINL